jgi:hypothetical protein
MSDHDEADGIKAVQDLQKMAGIDESHDAAKRGWRGMSIAEQDTTMRTHKMFFPQPTEMETDV